MDLQEVHQDDWKCTIAFNGEQFAMIISELMKLLLHAGNLVFLLGQMLLLFHFLGMLIVAMMCVIHVL